MSNNAATKPRTTTNPSTRADPLQGDLRAQGTLDVEGFGTLWLAWSGRGLVALSLTGQPNVKIDRNVRDTKVPARYAGPLRRYFEGDPVDPASLDVDLYGTAFQVRVWETLRAIPRGKVRTYGGVAADIGAPRAMRAVGMANRNNRLPLVVPCHRVVGVGHRLGGYSGGVDRKRFLLQLEGIDVEGDTVRPGQMELF
jgi:methylated-DNA-[protein]-cysteine S-methyltransferase